MIRMLEHFRQDESGAVTVDFVVITAIVGFLGIAVGLSVRNGATTLAGKIETKLSE